MAKQTVLENGTKKSERVEAIIRAAYEIMGRKGFVNVSLADIAAEAGVSKALLHYYFKDKDALVGDIYDYAMSEYLGRAISIFDQPATLDEKIGMLFDAFYSYIQENPDWFVVVMELTLLGIKNPARTRDVFAQHVRIQDLTAEALRKARDEEGLSPEVDLEVLASIMIAMANGFSMSYLIARETTDFPRFIAYFRKMIIDLMRTGGDGPART
jgi:AcrR family transcriptional regulator